MSVPSYSPFILLVFILSILREQSLATTSSTSPRTANDKIYSFFLIAKHQVMQVSEKIGTLRVISYFYRTSSASLYKNVYKQKTLVGKGKNQKEKIVSITTSEREYNIFKVQRNYKYEYFRLQKIL